MSDAEGLEMDGLVEEEMILQPCQVIMTGLGWPGWDQITPISFTFLLPNWYSSAGGIDLLGRGAGDPFPGQAGGAHRG
jgi:hypothetical protein